MPDSQTHLSDNVVAAPLKKHSTTTHDRRHP
ncbi:hypothetical protein J2X46_003607 [Nocardioides sp. BE266]|nr:hypothetical protein [Nocardioides sp. BE266]